jgi:RNA polymerase sigma-70 factor (ECF subfamily)
MAHPKVQFSTQVRAASGIGPGDAQLIAAMLAGDERAFRAFFDAYFPRVYRFALLRLAGDDDLAKEVVQATLVKAMRHLAGYRQEAALFSWLCQICRRQIVDQVRAREREAKHVVLLDGSAAARAILELVEAPAADEPQHIYDTAESRQLVHSVLAALPGRYGQILELKYIDGRTVEEIGATLGIGQTAAQSMLARARPAFRTALEALFGAGAKDLLAGMRGRLT